MDRKGLMATVTGLVAVVIAGSAAWACTPSADLSLVGASSALPGETVTVEATEFNAGPVEIRWDTATGAVLAAKDGPGFTLTVVVPADATAGVHYLVGAQEGSRNPAAPFSVRAVQAAPAPAPTPLAAADPSPADDPSPQLAVSPAAAAPSPSAATGDVAPGAAQAPATRQPAATAQTTRPADTARTTTATATAPRTTAATSAGHPTPGGSPAAPAADVSPAPPGATPSARSVSGDVWSGFAAGGRATDGPSLATPSGAHRGSPSSVPALGAALLAFGLMGLAGGFALIGVQRRRAPAASSE